MTDDMVKRLRADNDKSFVETLCGEAADRIEALTVERDRAYARGYSDAETEISKSALGQRNDFLHSQYANAADHIKVLTADNARLLKALTDARAYLDKGLDKMAFNIIRSALNTGKEPSHE